jgi:hypothetical protein
MQYPDFYQAHIEDVISRYNAARAQIQNSASFCFFTDIHLNMNALSTVPMIKEIGRATDVKTVICGGDFPTAFGSENQCIYSLGNALDYIADVKENMNLYIARGNHDATIVDSREHFVEHVMPYDQVQPLFAACNSPADGAVNGRMYLYADDPATKTRYIILDTSEYHLIPDIDPKERHGITQEQLRWLQEEALHFDDGEGWSVVIAGHIPCCDQMPSCCQFPGLNEILQDFKNKTGAFSNTKAELVMYLCGHNHTDAHAYENGVLHVSTSCDAYYKDGGLTRMVGTENESIVDLFLVDKDEKNVKVFRIGAGKDREFSY